MDMVFRSQKTPALYESQPKHAFPHHSAAPNLVPVLDVRAMDNQLIHTRCLVEPDCSHERSHPVLSSRVSQVGQHGRWSSFMHMAACTHALDQTPLRQSQFSLVCVYA